MKTRRMLIGILILLSVFMSAACSSNNGKMVSSDNHKSMNMSDSNDVSKNLQKAIDPVYKVGSHVVITADHMKDMKGAEATVTGAYDTIAYTVSYTPTTGSERVKNHKWVIQEEIKDAGDKPLKPGTKVTLGASHMKGMDGATAIIDSAVKTTVYMVDYKPTTGGDIVKNHKWVTENELSAK